MATVHRANLNGRPWCGAAGNVRVSTELAKITCVGCLKVESGKEYQGR